MATDTDIAKFVDAIGATEPLANDESYASFRRMFKRHNYFLLNGRFLIVKISWNQKLFWGVGKEVIDFLNDLNDYYLVLLVPGSEGWVFSKAEVNANIRNRRWLVEKTTTTKSIHRSPMLTPSRDRRPFAKESASASPNSTRRANTRVRRTVQKSIGVLQWMRTLSGKEVYQ